MHVFNLKLLVARIISNDVKIKECGTDGATSNGVEVDTKNKMAAKRDVSENRKLYT